MSGDKSPKPRDPGRQGEGLGDLRKGYQPTEGLGPNPVPPSGGTGIVRPKKPTPSDLPQKD